MLQHNSIPAGLITRICMKKLLTLLLPAFILSSCLPEKKTTRPRLKLESNSPVKFEEKLRVFIDSDDDYSYTIIHPDGRQYNDFYETDKAVGSDAGKYIALVYNDDGRLFKDSIKVEITPKIIPCNHEVNRLTTEFLNVNLNFYSVYGATSVGDEYEVKGHSHDGDLTIRFGHPERPLNSRTYISKLTSGFNTTDELSVSVNWQGQVMYGMPDQYVHVEADSTSLLVTLCNFQMNGPTISATANARIEVK